jgi:hypothetical protein
MRKSDFLPSIQYLLFRLIIASCDMSSIPFQVTVRSPKFLTLLFLHTMFFDPGRPSKSHHIDLSVLTSVTLNTSSSTKTYYCRDTIDGAGYASGIMVSSMVYRILCVHFTLTVASHSATLDKGSWLDLALPELSSGQKSQALLGVLTVPCSRRL